MLTYTTDETIREILEHPETRLSAEAKNTLNFAVSTHPIGRGKNEIDRIQEAVFAIAGRDVHPTFRERLDRLARQARKQITT